MVESGSRNLLSGEVLQLQMSTAAYQQAIAEASAVEGVVSKSYVLLSSAAVTALLVLVPYWRLMSSL